jgi:hypothetical protein
MAASLSMLDYPRLVTAGLDPAVHAEHSFF